MVSHRLAQGAAVHRYPIHLPDSCSYLPSLHVYLLGSRNPLPVARNRRRRTSAGSCRVPKVPIRASVRFII